jgi:mono/diheme cytochrome c family protein
MKKSTQWMGLCAIALCSAAALSGCSSTPDPAPANAGGTSAGGAGSGGAKGTQLQSPSYFVKLSGADVTAGMPYPAAYMTAGCNACHGEHAEGSLIGPENRFTPKDYAIAVVRNGRNTPANTVSAMAAFATTALSDADLEAINTWQNSFPKPATPQGIYLAMCGNCHGPTSPTGGSAPISIQGKPKMDVQMFVRNGFGADFKNRAEYMPKFDATLLSETDLAQIETFLGSM